MAWCRQEKAITGAIIDPDVCRQMASLGLNELHYGRHPNTTEFIDILHAN